jgi:hypothetical protein
LAKANSAHLACWPIWPAGPASPPGSAKTARLGSGSNHRPSPAPHSSSSLTPELTGDWIAAVVARRFRPAPMTLAGAFLGKILATEPSFISTKRFRRSPLRGDRGDLSPRDLLTLGTPDAMPRRLLPRRQLCF